MNTKILKLGRGAGLIGGKRNLIPHFFDNIIMYGTREKELLFNCLLQGIFLLFAVFIIIWG